MGTTFIKYPRGLSKQGTIGVTAPSSGVGAVHLPRLDLVLNQLHVRGFKIREGQALRGEHKGASATAKVRATDLIDLWNDPKVDVIIPPWGGELCMEILPLIDFDSFGKNSEPKWILGYSDTSSLLFTITLKTGIATAHGPNLMDLIENQVYGLTSATFEILAHSHGETFIQRSFPQYQLNWTRFEDRMDAPFNLEAPTIWKCLDGSRKLQIKGRLIGGCLDTLVNLTGTPFGNLNPFTSAAGADGVIFYLENCELHPCAAVRALWNMRYSGWFSHLNGILLGRSAAKDASGLENLTYSEGVKNILGDLGIPVIFDVDIGHRPPQFTLINGAYAEVSVDDGLGTVLQTLR